MRVEQWGRSEWHLPCHMWITGPQPPWAEIQTAAAVGLGHSDTEAGNCSPR